MLPSLFRKVAVCALSICFLGSFGEWKGQDVLRDALAPVLSSTGSAARLSFSTPCSTTESAFGQLVYPTFPQLRLAQIANGASGYQAVHDILRADGDAVISADRTGLTRITVGALPNSLLNTRISQMALTPTEQWNPFDAIMAIEHADEVTRSMHAFNIQGAGPLYIDIVLRAPGDSRAPHLPPFLRNVTMDQALAAVANTFREMLTYGICTRAGGRSVMFIDDIPLTECDAKRRIIYSCFERPRNTNLSGPKKLSPWPSSTPQR